MNTAQRHEPDDIDPIVGRMHSALRTDRRRVEDLPSIASSAGLQLVTRSSSPPRTFSESPLQVVDQLRTRTFSSLWDLDDSTWAEVVEAVIDQLCALPQPERPRSRSARQDVLVFARCRPDRLG